MYAIRSYYGSGGPFEQSRAENWREPFEVNLVGTLQVTRALLPLLSYNFV